MPKQRITKEMVVNAAFEIARSSGMGQVVVKSIAERIGCSVQPIYSYCRNMDGLRQEVAAKTRSFVQEYVAAHVEEEDLFASTGRAYVRLAKEEPYLFRIFILHQRSNIASLEELYQSETDPHMAQMIAAKLKISVPQAKKLHLHMLIYTIGIGTIFSVTTPGVPADEIHEYQELAYRAFLGQAVEKRE